MKIKGVNIREVWDFRLSKATALIVREGGTWVVHIFSKVNPDYNPKKPETSAKPLESHDTGIKVTPGDERDVEKVKVCFKWLLTVRDKYALKDIEKRKPLVAKINAANQKLGELNEVARQAKLAKEKGVK